MSYVPNLLSGQPQTHPQAQDGGVVSIVRTDTCWTVFFLPRLLLSFTSTRPDACLDFRVKSGALEPEGIAINVLG